MANRDKKAGPCVARGGTTSGARMHSVFKLSGSNSRCGAPRHANFDFVPSPAVEVSSESHGPPSPLLHEEARTEQWILSTVLAAKSPVSTLLLAPSGRLMRQVRIGFIVEEAEHDSGERLGSNPGTMVKSSVGESVT